MTNTGTHRPTTSKAISKAKKVLRNAHRKITRLDESGETQTLAKLKDEAYKLETMIAETDTRCAIHKVFCDRVRARREKLGMTQAEIAEKLGVVSNTYAAIEQGRASPSLDTVSRVADALECKPFDLLK